MSRSPKLLSGLAVIKSSLHRWDNVKTCCRHTPSHRYYRDAQQTQPEEEEDAEEAVNAHGGALDPQELLRVAEEQANVDQVS